MPDRGYSPASWSLPANSKVVKGASKKGGISLPTVVRSPGNTFKRK